MQIKRISSDVLPALAASVKEVINQGRWTLFRTHQTSIKQGIAYHIKGHDHLYRLDISGEVVSIGAVSEAPSLDEILYFSDVASPPSLSERPCGGSAGTPLCCRHQLEERVQ